MTGSARGLGTWQPSCLVAEEVDSKFDVQQRGLDLGQFSWSQVAFRRDEKKEEENTKPSTHFQDSWAAVSVIWRDKAVNVGTKHQVNRQQRRCVDVWMYCAKTIALKALTADHCSWPLAMRLVTCAAPRCRAQPYKVHQVVVKFYVMSVDSLLSSQEVGIVLAYLAHMI